MNGTRTMTYADATLADFTRDLWAGRAWLAAGMIVGLAAAALFLMVAVPHYRVIMIVAPVAQYDGDKAEDAARAAPLDFARFESMLRGPTVAQSIMRDEEIMKGLAADRRWRAGAGPKVDNAARVADYLERRVAIEPVAGTGLRRIVYTHPDPAFAVKLPGALTAAADTVIREEGQRGAVERAGQLSATLAQTQNAAHRRTLTDMLMGEERARMVLAMAQPFAARIAEPAAAGPKPYWPRKAVVVPVMAMMGAFFGFALFSLRRRAA